MPPKIKKTQASKQLMLHIKSALATPYATNSHV